LSGWDFQIGTVYVKADFPDQAEQGGTSASGVWTFQNSTPTDVRFQNSEPGFGDTAPYSARTYANQSGSIGKQTEIQAPADLARPYLCDLQNTRPGYLAPRLTWERGANVTFVNTPNGGQPNSPILNLVDSATQGMGAVIAISGGGTDQGWWYYRYSMVNGRYETVWQCKTTGPFNDTYVKNLRAQVRCTPQSPILRETLTHIWAPLATGGAVDLSQTYAVQAPTMTNVFFWHFISFAGYLITFEQTDPNGNLPGMTISMRNPQNLAVLTPTTLSGIDAAPELGNDPIQEPVPDVIYCYPPIVYNGAIYLCTDRSVLKVVYDDNNARLLVVPVHTSFTRITGNPEIFQGGLFVPSGNTLQKWVPGQLEFTPIPVDSFGTLPDDRGGGVISALRAVSTGLCLVTQSSPSDQADSCLLMMDANSTFQMIDYATNNGVVLNPRQFQMCHFFDAYSVSSGPAVGFVCATSSLAPNAATRRVVAVRESSRDPVFLSAARRPQVPGSHFWIAPVDAGVNYGDAKQLLRLATACADVSANQFIRIYYQTDSEINWPTDTMDQGNGGFATASIPGTIMRGQGIWHLALTLNSGTAGLVQSPNTGYWGYVQKSLVTQAISYRQIRWCVEIVGDTSGTLYPRLLGLKTYYSETPAMYIVHSLRIRIMVNDPDLADAPTTGGGNYPPTNATDVYNQFNQLYTYAKNGTFVQFLDVNGDTRWVKITKLIFNGIDLADTAGGIPQLNLHRHQKMVLQLALQEGDSAA
jgi:hypothetical protein